MTDAYTGRLCTEIIHSHFGPLTAKIASVLLTRGRLSLAQIIRFTSQKPRTTRAALLVLIQHNIVWHAQLEDEGEIFELNTDECLTRLRFGKYVWQTEKLLGKTAADIVQTILDHGKLRPPDLMSLLSIHDTKGTAVYTQALHKLVGGGYLKASTNLSHISPRDKRIKYEAEEKAKIVGFPAAKDLREARQAAEARLKRDEEEAEKVGIKRKNKDQLENWSNKRKTISTDETVDDSVYFRINHDKYSIHVRNAIILEAAKQRYNEHAALILQAVMKCTEISQLSIRSAVSEPISIANILMQLPDGDDLSSRLIYNTKNVSKSTCVKDYLNMLSSADNPTPIGKCGSFISFNSSKVQVEFELISRRLRRRVLEAATREKHGVEGLRILRLLLDTGKMDEKQISKIVMMTAKDVRPLLAALASDSLISTQEVPKSADRNPARTFYLWYVDTTKVHSVLLGSVYKTLYNISMRRRAEQEVGDVKVVLEKRERTDVSQDENLLTRLERNILKEWEEKRQKLTLIEQRVEETLFILKELCVDGAEVL